MTDAKKKETSFNKAVLKTAIPIFIGNLSVFTVTFSSSLFVGKLGAAAISALYAAGQIQIVLQTFSYGVESALCVICSRLHTSRDKQGERKSLRISLVVSLIFGLLTTIVCIFASEPLLSIFINGKENIDTGIGYLRLSAISFPLFTLSHALSAFLKSTGEERATAIISLAVLIINIPTNLILIFGVGAFSGLSIYGAALTLIISRALEFSLLLFALVRGRKRISTNKGCDKEKKTAKPVLNETGKATYISHATTLFIAQALWGINLLLCSFIMRKALSESSYAMGVVNTVNSLAFVLTGTVSTSVAVTLGKYLTDKKERQVKESLMPLIRLFILLGIFLSLILTALRPLILSLYELDSQTLVYSKKLLSILSLSLLFTPFCTGCVYGIIRGMAESRFVLLCELFTVFFFSLPLGLILYRLSAPAEYIFLAIKSEQILKCPIGYLKIKKAKGGINQVSFAVDKKAH